jgi:RAD3-like DEAD/DEAH box helicase
MATSQIQFDELFERLILNDCLSQIPSLKPTGHLFTNEESGTLLFYASGLANAADGTREGAIAGRKAYDIATRLLKFSNGNRESLKVASDYILSQIGNFPARTLVRGETLNTARIAAIHPFLALTILAREADNTIEEGQTLLTDFQVKLLGVLREFSAVSFSAPTSAGKSTALEFDIVRRLRNPIHCLVLLVPTRALIRQVTFDLVQLLNREGLNDVPVVSAPDPLQIQAARPVVCVFTQERLQTLLVSDEWQGSIDALIVDEAQEIGEGSRGQTLELTILQVLRRYPNCSVFFSSPLRSNPEYLLQTVGRAAGSASFVEHSAPVTQNIFLLRPVRGVKKRSSVSVWFGGTERSLGTIDLPFSFRGSKYLADFPLLLTGQHDSSIIYAGEASRAEDLALHMAEQLEPLDDPEIDQLASFARDQVHSEYLLAEVATKGVAFHYGKLPQILRSKVEDLLRDRHLRFVFCTSTLLQGVNLPTKNIFIENPKKGRGQAMSTSDFWNLAGRAGRLAKEFQGNIFCIYGQDWETKPFTETRFFPLESAFERAVTTESSTLLQVAQQPPESSESEMQWAEQALARICMDFTDQGTQISESRFSNPSNHDALRAVDNACLELTAKKTLPPELYRKNPYLLPPRLDALAAFFRNQVDLTPWIPANPFVQRNYYRYEPIFKTIEDLFLRRAYDRHKYFTVLALQWMTGVSLKQLVQNRLEFKKVPLSDKRKINAEIRGLFEDIEDQLRYTYVKYFKVYSDVLRAVLAEKGLSDLQSKIPSIHLFLEYGAANITLINLMSLGLSRTSALLLKSYYGLGDQLTTQECQNRLDRVDLLASTLPALCRAEIAKLRRH